MDLRFRSYRPEDFLQIRELLVSSYEETGQLGNWLIDRWNFCRMVSQTMHETFDSWEETVGVWEDETGTIIGVVNSEGEERGEAFFQIRFPLPASILEEMFNFAEKALAVQDNRKRSVRMRIPAGDIARESIASARGYVQLDWEEPTSVYPLHNLNPVNLPPGFHIQAGDNISNEAKALAHAKAFGYYEETQDRTVPLAFERMKQAPDYRADLDLSIVNDSGEVVSFCTIWYDANNRHGILEPVGTIPQFRKNGLGRAVISEGLHRIAKEGAQLAYVGSDMEFYKRLGFQCAYRSYVWEKSFDSL